MAKNGTEFSKYARAFREVIDGNKTDIDILTKELLKMGLTVNDKNYINEEYPEYIDDNGERHIAGNKGDTLRKYFGGTNDLSRLIPKLETEFDSEFQERYCEELQDFDDSKLIEFAHRYQLNITEDDIDSVTEAIAELYASILKNVSTKKRSKPIVSEGNLKSDKNSIVLSYTFTEPEKQALVKLCELIKTDLRRVKQQTDKICDKKHELNNLTTSEADERWKPHLESDIRSTEKRFNEAFTKLEKLCTDLVNLLKPKTDMDAAFPKLISFANNIGNDEYKITCHGKFKYKTFNLMVSNFNECIERTLRAIDRL